MGHVENKLCYVIRLLLIPCLPNYDTPFQYSVFRIVRMQSLYNFVHHIMTPNFEDDELWKIIVLYLGKYYIFNI